MCGRYFLDTLPEVLMRRFGAPPPAAYEPHWNIAPTQYAPVLRAHGRAQELAMLRWGLIPSWAKDASVASKLINARGDGVAEKPSFRAAFRLRRCVVPATGFYEWKVGGDGKTKTPYAIVPTDGPCFGLGGLWEHWTAPDGRALETFTILTTDANEFMRGIHHRMPLILAPEDFPRWIACAPDQALQLIAPCPSGRLHAYPVSRAVNSSRNDEPGLSQPIAADSA